MNTYILKSNKKAIKHFQDLGIKLIPGKKRRYVEDGAGDIIEYAKPLDVFYVNIKISGRKFHKYLVDNNLLE